MRSEDSDETPPPPPHRQGRVGLWTVLGVFVLFGLVVVAGLSLTGRTLVAPDWVRAEVETRLNDGLDQGALRLGQIELAVSRRGRAELLVRDVTVSDPTGAKLADLNLLRTSVALGPLVRGDIKPSSVSLRGAQVTVRRDIEGQFTLSYGGGAARQARDIAGIIDELETTLSVPSLAGIDAIAANDLTITLEDARSGRLWQATNASLTLNRTDAGLNISVASELFNGTDALARVQLSAQSENRSSAVRFGATVTDVPASDIAAQAPALSYFAVLDAPLSGAIRTALDDEGALEDFAATLEIGQGALRPVPDAQPVPFDRGRAYFTFDPNEQRLAFSEVSVQSDVIAVSGDGQAWLGDFDGNWPQTLTAQLNLREARIDPDGVFERPVAIGDATADMRLRLDPFSVELGRFSADVSGSRVGVTAAAGVGASGWDVALDATVDAVDQATAMDLWPQTLIPKTRRWLDRNITAGVLTNISAAVRIADGAPPIAGVSFDFEEAAVRYLPEMAPLTAASGRASLFDHRFSIALERGRVAGSAGPVDLAGSRFAVPDIRDTPSTIVLDLETSGPIEAALAVLSAEPIALLSDTPITPSDFRGTAEISTRLAFQTGRDPTLEELSLSGSGVLNGIESTIVPDRLLTAQQLGIVFDNRTVALEGNLALDGIPATARWSRAIGRDAPPGNGRVEGVAEVSAEALDVLGLDLPPRSVSGSTEANFEIDLPEAGPPVARLTSDLTGLGLALQAINWSKPDPVSGDFAATLQLGDRPEVLDLSLRAPGLRADDIDLLLTEDRQFAGLRVPALRLGDWLDGPVSVIPQGAGRPPLVTVEGGAIDIRALDLAGEFGGGGRGGGVGTVRLNPDRVIVSEGIMLGDFSGELNGGSGAFRARLNGRTPIRGQIIEVDRGTALRIISDDAGGVVRDAGFLRNGDGGLFDLLLVPSGRPGTYVGELLIENVTVRDAPALAALLDAISIVGLLDDGGTGIRFDTVDAQFRLSANGLELVRSAAVGASMGISMDGVYDLRTERMDMQGVVSPLYALNGLGSIFTRRGEGLFGFNFRMTGDANAPRIVINPLSLFTPGMFREIFRRPAPRVDGRAPTQ